MPLRPFVARFRAAFMPIIARFGPGFCPRFAMLFRRCFYRLILLLATITGCVILCATIIKAISAASSAAAASAPFARAFTLLILRPTSFCRRCLPGFLLCIVLLVIANREGRQDFLRFNRRGLSLRAAHLNNRRRA